MVILQNASYIDNPSYPTAYSTTGSCSYTVTRCSTGIVPVHTADRLFQIHFASIVMPLFLTKYIQISEICQVRLDFFKVVLQQPTSTTGSCTHTYTTITPGATGVTAYNRPPALCGTLTDQHCTKTTLLSFWTTNIFNSYRYHILSLLRLFSFIYSYEFLYFSVHWLWPDCYNYCNHQVHTC